MSSKDLMVSIIRYVRSRYDIDITSSEKELVMKKAEYLARARRDKRLYEYIAQYRSIHGGLVIPILKKTISKSVPRINSASA